MRSHLKDAEPRTCPICQHEFIPVRRIQRFCPPACPCGGRCRYSQAARAYVEGTLDPRACEKCGREFTPRARDQRTCGTECPGKPDTVLMCASLRCPLPEREEDGQFLLAREFVIKGNSQGKGNQKYCSERCRDRESQWRMRERFRRYGGLTPEQYQAKAEAQGNKCAICGREPEPDPRPGHWGLDTDHCHLTGQLRDLLCGRCNKGLGMFGDDPALLRVAADYIERWQRVHADIES